jgi:hypothetical protein
MGQRSTHWATGIWLLLCTGLAGIVALELSLPLAPQVTAALPPAPLPEFAPEPAPFDPPSRGAFAQIAARPLFSQSRRPIVSESEAEEERPDDTIAIELVGTLLTEQGWAALLQPQNQNARWLRADEKIAGWQVGTIERDQVSLHLDDKAKILQLRADLVQPATPPKGAERRRVQQSAEPDDRDQAQDQEQEIDQAGAGENKEAEPQTE